MNNKKSLLIFLLGFLIILLAIFYISGTKNKAFISETSDSNNSTESSVDNKLNSSNEINVSSESVSIVDSSKTVELGDSSEGSNGSNSTSETIDTSLESIDTTNSSIENKELEDKNKKDELQSDWKTNFEKELKESYNVTVKKYEDLGNGLYGVYVNEIDTGDMPYVTVDSQTGNFHG